MYEWFNNVGYEADILALSSEYPELTTLERYLHGRGWENAGHFEGPLRGVSRG